MPVLLALTSPIFSELILFNIPRVLLLLTYSAQTADIVGSSFETGRFMGLEYVLL